MKTKKDILKKVLELENDIDYINNNNPYENGVPIQSDYYQNLNRIRSSTDALIWTLEDEKEENNNAKNTKVISGFPGVGKSYIQTGYRNIENFMILDSDSSEFSWIEEGVRHPDFPNNYMRHIKENLGKVNIIFVSSHDIVRQALQGNGIDYTLIYPDVSLKDIYIDRYKKRGNNEAFIKFISSNWESFIDNMNKETFPANVRLNENEFLFDVIFDILK